MPTTPNGFTVLAPGSKDLGRIDVHGVPFVVWRPTLRIVKHLTTFLHSVEPVTEVGWDGGHAHRLIRGSKTQWSEHASGTAIDWNASQHPMGVDGTPGWSDDQERVIRWYLNTTVGQMWEWGADYKREDSMHFCLKSRAQWDRAVKAKMWWTT
jgi:hypothetical protein